MFCQYIGNCFGYEPKQYERVYPRPAERIIPVGVSRFREEMDAERTDPRLDPRMAGAFEPQIAPAGGWACGRQAIRRLMLQTKQAEQPERISEKMETSSARRPEEKNRKLRSCTLVQAGAVVPSLFTHTSGKVFPRHSQTPVAPPQSPIAASPNVQAERVDSSIQRPRPAAICRLRRSNAVRRPVEQHQVPKPVPCRLRRANAVRHLCRRDSVVPVGVDYELGYYPNGEADSYFPP